MPALVDAFAAMVRPLVTYAFVVAIILGFFLKLIPADPVTSAGLLILGYWFGERSALKVPNIRCPLGCALCNGAPPAPNPTPPTDSATVSLTLPTKGWRG